MGGAARPDHAVASNPSSSRQLAVGFGASLHEVVENAKIQPQAGDGPVDRGAAEAAPEIRKFSQVCISNPARRINLNVRKYILVSTRPE
jgi:hypothetical protein